MSNGREMEEHDRRPVPDPTFLTTEALRREIEGLKELLEQRIDNHGDMCTEKFTRIESKFDHVEALRVEQKSDTEKAVAAALTALKELLAAQTAASQVAIDKSEKDIKSQREQMESKFEKGLDAISQRVADNKETIGSLTSQINGVTREKVGAKEDRSALYATIGIGIAILLALVTLAGPLLSSAPNAP